MHPVSFQCIANCEEYGAVEFPEGSRQCVCVDGIFDAATHTCVTACTDGSVVSIDNNQCAQKCGLNAVSNGTHCVCDENSTPRPSLNICLQDYDCSGDFSMAHDG